MESAKETNTLVLVKFRLKAFHAGHERKSVQVYIENVNFRDRMCNKNNILTRGSTKSPVLKALTQTINELLSRSRIENTPGIVPCNHSIFGLFWPFVEVLWKNYLMLI